MKRSTRILAVGLAAGLVLSCDEGRLVTEIDSEPLAVTLGDVTGPDTVNVGNPTSYSIAVMLGSDQVTADAIDWSAAPAALLALDTADHATSIQITGRAPGNATLTATVDHPDLATTQRGRDIVVVLLGVEPVAPASGDTTLTAVDDAFTVRARGVGDPAPADSAGLAWTHKGSALSVTPPLTGRDTLRVTAQAAGTDTLIFRQSQGFCREGKCVDTIFVRVTQTPARVEAQDSVQFGELGATATPTVAAFDRNNNAIAGAAVDWALVNPGDSVVVGLGSGGLLTARANGTARVAATAGAAADTVDVTVHQTLDAVSASSDLAFTALGAADTVSLTALDPGGAALERGYSVSWSSRSPTVADLSALGDGRAVVTATGTGSTYVVGTAESRTDSLLVTVSQTAATVSLAPDSLTLDALDAATQLTATVRDINGNTDPDAAVTWSSTATGIAAVSATGQVTAVGVGTAQIIAQAGTAADTGVVVVRQVPASIVTTDTVTLDALTAEAALSAVVKDTNGNTAPGASVAWTLLTGSAVTLSGDTVTAVANGTATVQAMSGSVADTTTVVVAQVVDSVNVTPTSLSYAALSLSDTVDVSAFDPLGQAYVPNPTVTWSSDDAGVASVAAVFGNDDRAVVTSAGDGATWIRASISGVQDSIPVTVSQGVDTVVVTPLQDTLDALGDTVRLNADPQDANGQSVGTTVTWASLDGGVATVSAGGLVTAVDTGTVGITATAGSRVTTATITVRQVPASINVTDTLSLTAFNQVLTLSAAVKDANGNTISGASVTWTQITGAGVADVSVAGDVTAQDNGLSKVEGSSGSAKDTAVVVVQQAVDSVDIATAGLSYAAYLVADTVEVTAFDANGSAVTRAFAVSWSSTAPSVAGVTQLADTTRAQIQALSDGSARIDATVEGKTDSVTVTVAQAVDSVVIVPVADTLNAIGYKTVLTAQPIDANGQNADDAVTWTALDAAVATMGAGDTITALTTGTARFTAAAGGVEDTATVLVRQVAKTVTVTPDPVTDTLLAGDTMTLSVAVTDSGGTAIASPLVTWAASPDTAVSVDSTGLVTGQSVSALDSAWVSATSGPAADSVQIFVNTAVLTSVAVTVAADTITALTDTAHLAAQGLNQNGNPIPGESFTWQSRNTGVATVAASTGVVTAVEEGQVYVVATSNTNGSLLDSALVVVDQVPTSVAISPTSWTFNALNDTKTFSATATDAKGQTVASATFTWGDDLSGKMTHLGAGQFRADQVGSTIAFVQVVGASSVVDTADVTIQQIPASIAVSPSIDTISVNGTTTLTAVVSDSNANTISGQALTWGTLDPDTATVDASGTVTGVAAGTAEIIAYPTGYGSSVADTAQITVAAYTLAFDGGDYATAGTGLNLDAASESAGFTLEVWIYPTSASGDEYLISKGGTPDAGDKATASYGLYLKDGKPAFYSRYASGNKASVDSLVAGSALTTNTWHHVAVTFDNTSSAAILYVDGSSVATGTLAGTPVSSTATVFLGASSTTPDNAFTGRLDEVRFWSGVRSGTEISAAYQSPLVGDETNLLAYWPFDEGTGSTTPDLVGAISAVLGTAAVGDAAEPTWTAESPAVP